MNDEELTADGNWCPDCGEPRGACRCPAGNAIGIPVDRSKRCMLSGAPETPDHREIDPATGMQKDYVVLCPEERAKGFVRPVRRSYKHLTCGSVTTMVLALAETYARDPGFYSGTMCVHCRAHFPLDQFVWAGTSEQLGT